MALAAFSCLWVSEWSRSVVSDSLQPRGLCPPGSSVHGILQARILQWVAISFSRGSSQPRDQTQVSCIAGRRFNLWATREGPLVVFNFIQNNFVRLYSESCHIACFLKKLFKIVEFLYSHFNIKDRRKKSNIFSILCFIISRKVKTQLKHKKRFGQHMEKCYDWSNVSKVVFRVLWWRFLTGWCSISQCDLGLPSLQTYEK